MQSIKYVGAVKPVEVLENNKVGSRYLEIIDDLIEVFIKVAIAGTNQNLVRVGS